MDVVVYGAGAVGSTLGGLLALHEHNVVLVCRSAHADAVNESGLRLRSATGDYVAHPRAVVSLDDVQPSPDTCWLVTVKSYDLQDALDALSSVAPAGATIVTFQNGMEAEALSAERFEKTYGGVCRMTCSMLQPGHVSFRRVGRVIVGRYPRGSDAVSKRIVAAFTAAGFDACASRAIMSDKWLKLAVNTQSVFHAVIDPRDHEANEFFEVKARILEETARVFKAARIRARSGDGRDPTIAEMVAELRRPRARRTGGGMKVHNSTWQNLYLKRRAIENTYFHRPIIDLGREHGVPTPCNDVALDIVEHAHSSGSGPETLRLSDVLGLLTAAGENI